MTRVARRQAAAACLVALVAIAAWLLLPFGTDQRSGIRCDGAIVELARGREGPLRSNKWNTSPTRHRRCFEQAEQRAWTAVVLVSAAAVGSVGALALLGPGRRVSPDGDEL